MKKKSKHETHLVIHPRQYKKMAGSNILEKKINSLLTCEYIVSTYAPFDECLTEAREIVENDWHTPTLVSYLKKQFGPYPNFGHDDLADEIVALVEKYQDKE